MGSSATSNLERKKKLNRRPLLAKKYNIQPSSSQSEVTQKLTTDERTSLNDSKLYTTSLSPVKAILTKFVLSSMKV